MKLIAAIIFAFNLLEAVIGQNEGVTLDFDNALPTGYVVEEDDMTLMVCVVAAAENGIQQNFEASVNFITGGATPGVDYIAPTDTVTFTYTFSSPRTRCVPLTILQDDILEQDEFIVATLSTNDDSVTLLPTNNMVLISIQDSNTVSISFEDSTYTTQEGGSTQVCLFLIGNTVRSVSFSLSFSPLTATINDYVPLSTTFTFLRTDTNPDQEICTNIGALNDNNIESLETFQISVSTNDDSVIKGEAVVMIEDVDGATVGLQNSALSVMEGDSGLSSLSVCVVLLDVQSSLDRNVTVQFFSSPITADFNDDFVPLLNAPLTFPAGTSVGVALCVDLLVFGDEIREGDETLILSVIPDNPLDVIAGPSSVTVTIVDEVTDDIADCGPLEDPENGFVTFSDTLEDTMALYGCSVGREIQGDQTRTCLDSEEWSGNEPTCELVDCSAPPSPPSDGGVEFTSTTYLSLASYSCFPGHNLVGTEQRQCLEDSMWSGSTPSCKIVDCGDPPVLPDGSVTLDPGTTTFGSAANYECDEGYMFDSGSILTTRLCTASGEWSSGETCEPVECPLLSDPADGRVLVTDRTFTNNATYECDEGFFLSGMTSRQCQADMTWSGTEPDCIVQCVDLAPPLNGGVSLTGTLVRDTASYSCDLGYVLESGDTTRTCSADGTWTGVMPTCAIVDCESLPAPTNGNIQLTSTTYLSTANYSCDQGHLLGGGEGTRVCEAGGEWSGTAPTCTIVTCDVLTSPENGNLVFSPEGTREFGTIASYSCIDGYMLTEGDQVRECQDSGVWSGQEPSCMIVDCELLTPPSNGTITYTNSRTTFEAVVFYQCDEGHDLTSPQDDPFRTCLASGEWSGSDPICKPFNCGTLSAPSNGQVDDSVTTFGAEAVYVCNEGFNLLGDDRRTCSLTRQWSGMPPECQPVDCENLLDPEFGTVTHDATTFSSNATYSCNAGYNLNGTALRTCLADRNWSEEAPSCDPVNCGSLEAPENGAVSLDTTILGGLATYNCSVGYNLMGDEQRTCTTEGVWSGSDPECEIVDCGMDFEVPENGMEELTATTFTSRVTFSCVAGFELVGDSFRECLASGVWSGETPLCEVVICPQLPDPENGRVSIVTVSGSTERIATYECDPGFVNSDPNNFRLCDNLEGGTWSGQASECTILDCGSPSIPVNGSVNYTSTVFNSTAVYECDVGFILNPAGDLTRLRRCTESGQWVGPDPLCLPVDCGGLSNPDNGEVEVDSTQLGSSASYSCLAGYELVGVASRTCATDGMWSSEEPTCEDVDECLDPELNDCLDICFNIPGGFTCDCSSGFNLIDSTTCIDIDECLEDLADCTQLCDNTQGSFLCTCEEGYQLAADNFTCNDVDECEQGTDDCNSELASCLNTEGGYSCMCLSGLTGSGVPGNGTTGCQDINECDNDVCDENADCENTFGSFTCKCHDGYQGNGISCDNVNECEEGTHNCDTNAKCSDIPGSFTCACDELFAGNGTFCTERCITVVQLVLTGVVDCSVWRFNEAPGKLSNIDSYVRNSISSDCSCNFRAEDIFESGFSCPDILSSDDVLYRTQVRGLGAENCDNVITAVESAIQSSSSILVLGNRLGIQTNCDVGAESISSELFCAVAPTTPPIVGAQGGNVGAIAGGAAAGVLVVLLLMVLVILVFVFKMRSTHKAMNQKLEFMETENNSSYGKSLPLIPPSVSPPEQHIYATPTAYGIQSQAETTSFNPNADVLPRMGTLGKQNRYIDVKIDPGSSNPVPVSIPDPEKEKEMDGFYEKISDVDSYEDVEEVYDEPTKTDLELTLVQAFDAKLKSDMGGYGSRDREGEGGSPDGSDSSVDTNLTKVAEEFGAYDTLKGKAAVGSKEGGGGNVRNSTEVAQNPLYDKLKHDRTVIM